MIDAGEVAIAAAACLGLGEDHRSGRGGANRRAAWDGDVDSLVELTAAEARAESRHDRTVDRPDQAAAVAALDRPGRQRSRPSSRQGRGELGLDRGHVAVQVLFGLRDPGERGLATAAGLDQGRLALLDSRAGAGEGLLFGGARAPGRCGPVLGRAAAGNGPLYLVTQES